MLGPVIVVRLGSDLSLRSVVSVVSVVSVLSAVCMLCECHVRIM